MSLISVSKSSSFVGSGGAEGFSSCFFLNLLIALINMNIEKAIIRKSTTL